jgi:hypothetical protein
MRCAQCLNMHHENIITEQLLILILYIIVRGLHVGIADCLSELRKIPVISKIRVGFQTQIVMTTKIIPTVSKTHSHDIRP